MQIQINSDKNIELNPELSNQVKDTVEDALDRFTSEITRIEVHLSDQNSHKGGADDKRCVIEARLKGRQPIAATHQAETIGKAIDGSADKIKRSIESLLGRKLNRR